MELVFNFFLPPYPPYPPLEKVEKKVCLVSYMLHL